MLDRVEVPDGALIRAHVERVAAELRAEFPRGVEIRVCYPTRSETDAVLQLLVQDLETLEALRLAAVRKISPLFYDEEMNIDLQSTLVPPSPDESPADSR